MDDKRNPFSGLKKRLKLRLVGSKRNPDGTGVNAGGEGGDSTSSLPQPEPHIVAGESCHGEGDRVDVAGGPLFTTDGPPQPDGPESHPAHGSDTGQEEGEASVEGGETDQSHSHPHPDVKVAVGSGRGGELEGVCPPPSSDST